LNDPVALAATDDSASWSSAISGLACSTMTEPDTAAPQVLYEKRGGIAYITLNRPEKRNALTPEMVVRLVDIWADVASDETIRVALVTGAGDKAL
jgi:1,4-dihydroxy-2-naphthoyl-CoA synthase